MNENQVLINELIELDKYNNKIQSTYQIILLLLKKDNKNKIVSFFQQNNIENIYIYGAGLIGKIFFDLIQDIKKIHIHAIVDSNANTDFDFNNYSIIPLSKELDNSCFFIVTPVFAYYKIIKDLKGYNYMNFLSILDIVNYDFFDNCLNL